MKYLLILLLFLSSCAPSSPPIQVKDSRFEITRVMDSIYLIKDKETGAEYLSRSQGGFIKLENKGDKSPLNPFHKIEKKEK